jgi:hypothetical protein
VEKAPTQDDDTTVSAKATFLANFIVQKIFIKNCGQLEVAPALFAMILRQIGRLVRVDELFVIDRKSQIQIRHRS